jgi:hypothetical protein
MKNKIALSSIAMDLKRVALGYHRGSYSMAEKFLDEALKRRQEVDSSLLKPYLVKLLKDIDKIKKEKKKDKAAEDALLYSTLFQNAI